MFKSHWPTRSGKLYLYPFVFVSLVLWLNAIFFCFNAIESFPIYFLSIFLCFFFNWCSPVFLLPIFSFCMFIFHTLKDFSIIRWKVFLFVFSWFSYICVYFLQLMFFLFSSPYFPNPSPTVCFFSICREIFLIFLSICFPMISFYTVFSFSFYAVESSYFFPDFPIFSSIYVLPFFLFLFS